MLSWLFRRRSASQTNKRKPIRRPQLLLELLEGRITPANPTSMASYSSPYSQSANLFIAYTASADTDLTEIDLYAKGPKDTGYSLVNSITSAQGLTGDSTSGSFFYNGIEGDGVYSFYSIASDINGTQPTPSSPDVTVVVDSAKPVSAASSPAFSSATTFTVS